MPRNPALAEAARASSICFCRESAGNWSVAIIDLTLYAKPVSVNILSLGRQQLLQGRELVRLEIGLVPADAIDAGEAHGEAGFMTGGALQAFEGHLQHKAALDLAHR